MLISGRFIREEKNRFLCYVEIDNKEELCYLPSSCKLQSFIDLEGKCVLLKTNASTKSKTKYSVFAVEYNGSFVLLNLAYANRVIEKSINDKLFDYLGARGTIEREVKISNYKVDLFLPESNTIIEIKSVISTEENALIPTILSERTTRQLEIIKSLLNENYKVVFIVLSLNECVTQIVLNNSLKAYNTLFQDCIQNGMKIKAYSAMFKDDDIVLKREIEFKV